MVVTVPRDSGKTMGNLTKPVDWRTAPRRGLAFAAGCAAIVLLLAGPAASQRVIGARTLPSVIVDLSVLDQLGPAPTLPQLLMPGVRAAAQPGKFGRVLRSPAAGGLRFPRVPGIETGKDQRRIVLKRPSSVKKKRKPRRKARKPPRRKAQVAKAAPKAKKARPAPAMAPVTVAKLPPPPKIVPAPKMSAVQPEKAPVAKPARPSPTPPAMTPSLPPPAAKGPPKPPVIARLPAPEIKLPPAPTVAGPKPVVKSAPKPQIAALPPSAPKIGPGRSLLLLFDSGSAKLKREATRKLKSVAKAMSGDDKLRLQLLAYASGSSRSASRSRRLSLSRALAARSYLIKEGVRSTRIDVRALGNKTQGGPPDRIDLIVTKR